MHAGSQCRPRRPRREDRPLTQDRPFAQDEADVRVLGEKRDELGHRAFEIGAVVVEELGNGDIPVGISKDRRVRVAVECITVSRYRGPCRGRLFFGLTLFEDLKGLKHEFRVLAQRLSDDFLPSVNGEFLRGDARWQQPKGQSGSKAKCAYHRGVILEGKAVKVRG